MNPPKGTAILVYGGQAGSEGKGKVAAKIAFDGYGNYAAPKVSICAFMTNAGHTAYTPDGKKFVVQQLPVAALNPNVALAIGPGAAIELYQLMKEIEEFEAAGIDIRGRLIIHPRAAIITPYHKAREAEITKCIASTMKGCGASLADKVLRTMHAVIVENEMVWFRKHSINVGDAASLAVAALVAGDNILVEGAQGYDLDINLGLQYPYCTSRMCHPTAVMADCGLPVGLNVMPIAVIRPYPIRVGNVVENEEMVGYSGDYGTQEISWKDVAERGGWPEPENALTELTTVTKRVRRVFEFDYQRISKMIRDCRPHGVAVMFADYLDKEVAGENTVAGFNNRIVNGRDTLYLFFNHLSQTIMPYGVGITHIGTGPLHAEMITYPHPTTL